MNIDSILAALLAPGGGALHLEARDGERGIARSWRLEVSRDLFGWTCVAWRWGRIGSRGQGRVTAFAAPEQARRHVRRLLQRRAGAPRRIGVGYQVTRA